MKKIIITLVTALFFSINLFFNAKAANSYYIIEDSEFAYKDIFILESGYYLLSQSREYIDSSMFKGDFEGGIREKGDALTLSEVKNIITIDSEHETYVTEMINQMNSDFYNSFDDDIYVLKVNSYALFTNLVGTYLEHFYIYGYKTSTKSDLTISGNMTHFVSVDSPTPLSEIKGRYSAYDNVDKDITSNIVFETNYDETNNKLGKYYIMATVSDNAGHETVAIDYIIVKDFTAPTISLNEDTIYVDVHTEFTSTQALEHFIVTDNYTATDNIKKVVTSDTYSNNYNTVGTYSISCYAVDEGGNKSETKTLTIVVRDQIKPTISLKAGGDTVVSDHVLSDSEILALLEVSDNYYSLEIEDVSIVENNCTGEQGKYYLIKVSITDGSGNVGESTFNYYLSDTISPIIRVDKTLYIEYGKTYTNEQIINMLKEAGIISLDATTVNISTRYIETTEKEEIYELTYQEILEDGTINEGTVMLTYFSLVEIPKDNNNYAWLFLLLIPIVIGLGYIVKRKFNHAKI